MKISSFANSSSAFVYLLAVRLTKSWTNRKAMSKMPKDMQRRIFLRNMLKMGGRIPHPIFSKIRADFSHLAKILFARSPQVQRMLRCYNERSAINFSPKTLIETRNRFGECVKTKAPFTIKLMDGKNNLILMGFTPEVEQVWSLTIICVDLNTGVSYTFGSLDVTIEITKNSGVYVNTRHSSLSLFYTNNVKMGIFGDITSISHFYLTMVEFYSSIVSSVCDHDNVVKDSTTKRGLGCARITDGLKKLRCN